MVRSLPTQAGYAGLTLGSGRSPGGGNGSPLQYSCLETPMDRGAWQAPVHGVESDTASLKASHVVHAGVFLPLSYPLCVRSHIAATRTDVCKASFSSSQRGK